MEWTFIYVKTWKKREKLLVDIALHNYLIEQSILFFWKISNFGSLFSEQLTSYKMFVLFKLEIPQSIL